MRTKKEIQSVEMFNLLILLLMVTILIFYSRSAAQDTSDWKTYTNEEYGYEVKYPPDLTIKYPAGGDLGDSKICFGISVGKIFPKSSLMYKNKMRLLSSLSLKDIIVSGMWQVCSDIRDNKISDTEVMEMIKWKSIVIGGIEGIQAHSSDNECINKGLPKSVVKRNNMHYYFPIFYGSRTEYDKMLSSFKFIK